MESVEIVSSAWPARLFLSRPIPFLTPLSQALPCKTSYPPNSISARFLENPENTPASESLQFVDLLQWLYHTNGCCIC